VKYLKIFSAALLVLLLVTIVTCGALYRKYNIEKILLDDVARKNISGSFITLSDGVTHYELAGPDTGPVVVLVHGFSVPYYIWDSTFYQLGQQGFRVLRYDEFGRGFSDRPNKVYEAAFLRKQLQELLAALQIKKVHALAGLSFGGPVTTDFITHFPEMVDKLVLIDPLYPDAGKAEHKYPEWVEEFLMAINPDDMVNGQLTDLKYPVQFPHWGEQYKVQMRYKGLRNALVSTRYHYAQPDEMRTVYQKVDALHKPVLLIWGKEDQTIPIRYADSLRQVLRVDYFPVDDAAHLPQMEKPHLVNEKIVAFLKAGSE